MPPATISFVEFGSGDAARSRAFLEQLFGWSFHEMNGGPQGWFQTASMRAGLHSDDPEPGILVFFPVTDLEAAVAKVIALGGEATPPGTPEPGFGRFAMCKDPQGIRFGLHQMEN